MTMTIYYLCLCFMLIIQLTLVVAQQCSEYQFDIPFFPGASCEDIYNKNPQSHEMSGYYWILDGPSRVYCGMSYTGLSCEDIYLNNQATREKSGYYRIINNNWMFCNMDAVRDALFRGDLITSCAGVEGVWSRIGNFDIAAGDNCPSPWITIMYNGANYCTGSASNFGCYSVRYSTNATSYQRVCGRASVYPKDTPDSFNNRGIDSTYIDGISITHGNPRQHIWTYAFQFGSCPNPASFVGTHYSCEVTVNSVSTLPWFYHQLSDNTQDDVEVRICTDEPFNNEAIFINSLELYVEYAVRDALVSRGDLISSCAGVEGVWRRIGNFDIAAGDNCPSPWYKIMYNGVNYCTGSASNFGCYSVNYSTNAMSYQRVCGRARVYPKDTPDSFNQNLGIDSTYIDGISVTHGNPRQHIWTYAF